ncbi:MAG TPA: DEAD/DEAH box helicase [Ktedonobacteraceae bacterium]|nr:DEAD/DEAH box helicase [Ktedonobacteraceae bacterium]
MPVANTLARMPLLWYAMGMNVHVYFHGGTLVLQGLSAQPDLVLPEPFTLVKGKWRCEAYHFQKLEPWLHSQGIRIAVPRWQRLALKLHDQREPHAYQMDALAAWEQAGHRGSVVLPTGSGKTFLAVQAIHRVQASTLVIVPTIDLLHMWYYRLTQAFQTEIGVYYSGEKLVQPVTVTTYSSAGDLMAEQGNAFKFLIADEVHHLPARTWGEAALMAPAPYRLGLTATYPEEYEQTHGRWRVDALIGPLVYALGIEQLVGQQLAEYRTQRIRVNLTAEERAQYNAAHAIYIGFLQQRQLRKSHGAGWLFELMRLSAFDPEARRALLARQTLLRIVESCQEKFLALDNLLHEFADQRVLIFTASNEIVYRISCEYLVPCITHETGAAERKQILDGFQAGTYRVLATSKVLNEGIDVPEVKVAIVLGGGSGHREYVQRLGRILRKKEQLQATLIEVLARNTIEESKVQRRRYPGRGLYAHR